MKLRWYSDIHTEFGPNFTPQLKDIEVLVLAGDIGCGVRGLGWLKNHVREKDVQVIYVPGNHEYYGYEIDWVNNTLWENTLGTNIHFLQNSSIIINGIRFIGATMWTDFWNDSLENMSYEEGTCFRIMNDYKCIKTGPGRFDTIQTKAIKEINRESVNYIFKTLKESVEPCVVVTHHKPYRSSRIDEVTAAYEIDLTARLDEVCPKLWIYGHTHQFDDTIKEYKSGQVRFLSNPHGYTHDRARHFDKRIKLEL